MHEYLKLAWRNLWRNKRRTLITSASVFFGVILSTIMTSMQEGSYAQYIQAIVNFYSGYIQIHQKGYWENKTINNLLTYTPDLENKLKAIKEITLFAPRLESYALASAAEVTKGVMVTGIAAEKEDRITRISKKVVAGRFLENRDRGVMLGSALAKYLHLNVGDTLVLVSQGYHGLSAAGKYPVRSIIHHSSPELDRSIVYMDIAECQVLFSAENRLTSLVIMVEDDRWTQPVQDKLVALLGSEYEVMNWRVINQLLIKQIESDRAGGYFEKGILYLIIGFGILGTVMMMIAERKKEFGVMMAVGTQKLILAFIVFLESLLIGLLGVVSGILGSLPIVWYFIYHPIYFTGQAAEAFEQMGFEPIMWFSIEPAVFYHQAITVFLIVVVISVYPVYAISRLKVIQALKA